MKILAVVIPYYKRTFFRECLASLAAQTDQRFTVYIGNDASPEDPEILLNEFKGKFNFTYKKFEDNLGGLSLTKQWERCIAMMQDEEWFMILGDDDYLSSNAVEEFYNKLNTVKEKKINVIKFSSRVIDEFGNILNSKTDEPLIKSSIEYLLEKNFRCSLSEHIFKKSQYEKYGFADFPLGWISDVMATLEFSEYGDILFIKNATCFVHLSPESISGNNISNKIEKRDAQKMFSDRICQNLNRFTTDQKKILFNAVEWIEKEKNIKIFLPNRFYEYYKTFGLKRSLQLFRK